METVNSKNIEIERSLLVFLCSGRGEKQLREKMISRLRGYAFRSVEHQVLFDSLQTMPLDRPEVVRELLPARLVRAGFPDFDLGPFFEPGEAGEQVGEAGGVSEKEAGKMCRELTESQAARGIGSRE